MNTLSKHTMMMAFALTSVGCVGTAPGASGTAASLDEQIPSSAWLSAPATCDGARGASALGSATDSPGLVVVLGPSGALLCVDTPEGVLSDLLRAEAEAPSQHLEALIAHLRSRRDLEGNPSPQPSGPGIVVEGNPSPQPSLPGGTAIEGNPSPQPSTSAPASTEGNPSPQPSGPGIVVQGNPSPQPSQPTATPLEGNPSPQPSGPSTAKTASNDGDGTREGNPSPQPSGPRYA